MSEKTLNLTKEDPIERMEELCEQGDYYCRVYDDTFTNGTLISCSLCKKGSNTIIAQECQFVNTTNFEEIRRVIYASLLYSIGLGPEEDEEQESSEDLLVRGMNLAGDMVSNLLDNIRDKKTDSEENNDSDDES